MKSAERSGKIFLASFITDNACSAVCKRPKNFNDRSFRDCTPTDNRFTPAFLKRSILFRSIEHGLTSAETSTSSETFQNVLIFSIRNPISSDVIKKWIFLFTKNIVEEAGWHKVIKKICSFLKKSSSEAF